MTVPPRERASLFASLGGAAKVLQVCLTVLREAHRGALTRPRVDALARDLGEGVLKCARVKLHVEGAEKLDPAASYLFMSNHESLMDIPLIFATAPSPPRMVTKIELFKIPIWGHALKTAEFIPVDRHRRNQAITSLRRARELMDRGICVWLAPEGTRSRDGSLLPFKKGGFMLAIETGATVVPVGIVGASRVIRPKHLHCYLDQEVTVRYGEPIDASQYDVDHREELMERVRAEIARLRSPQITSPAS